MNRTRWPLLLIVALLTAACQPAQPAPEPAPPAEEPAQAAPMPTAQWQCSNDLEISCDGDQCAAAESFTPMDVTFDDAGTMSVCAYTGCWEGTGSVTKSGPFVVVAGENLPFSTNPDDAESGASIVIALDQTDQVATLKAGAFAQPLRCEQQPSGS